MNAALYALDSGVNVVIANGQFKEINTISDIVNGRKIGTFFTHAERDVVPIEDQAIRGVNLLAMLDDFIEYAFCNHHFDIYNTNIVFPIFSLSIARAASRALTNLSPNQRAEVIYKLSELILDNQKEILEANKKDLQEAEADKTMDAALISRLALTPSKLKVLSTGLRQIADMSHDILGQTVRATRIGEGLDLHQITVPIGVLLVIFESRPDALPQVGDFILSIVSKVSFEGERFNISIIFR